MCSESNQYLKGKKPFEHLIKALLLLAFVIWNIQAAMVLIFCGFAASNLLKWIYYKLIRKIDKSAQLGEHLVVSAASSDSGHEHKDDH